MWACSTTSEEALVVVGDSSKESQGAADKLSSHGGWYLGSRGPPGLLMAAGWDVLFG